MPELVPFHIDLAQWEQERVATALTAVGDQLDLHGMYWDECDATRMLYGSLDPGQRAVYQQLVDAGVIGQDPMHGRDCDCGTCQTLEILADPEEMAAIEEGLADVAAGRMMNFEEFKAHLRTLPDWPDLPDRHDPGD